MQNPRKIHQFTYPHAFTYGDMRPGHTDREKREIMRKAALRKFPKEVGKAIQSWAFRIWVEKKGKHPFDVENVPKLIVDAFCEKQIAKDKSKYTNLGLYKDDTLDFVKMIEVSGERAKKDFTRVEIFAHK